MRALMLWLVMSAVGALTATVAADVYEYEWNDAAGDWELVNEEENGGPNESWTCSEASSSSGAVQMSSRTCVQRMCSYCHAGTADRAAFQRDRESRHSRVHFPRMEVLVGEGQRVSLGALVLTRASGRLEGLNAKGRRVRFPADARVIRGRDGRPALVAYSGPQKPVRVP